MAAQTITNIQIGQVGSFVQNAEQSVVQGSVESIQNISRDVNNLVQQVEQLLPASHLPAPIEQNAREALGELKNAANSSSPDSGRLQKGLQALKRVLAPASETLLKLAIDAAVSRILGPGAD